MLLAIFATGCSTANKAENMPGPMVKVVEQSDKRPLWANITRTAYRDGDKMRFLGYFTADGDARPSAAIHGSGTKATAMPMSAISDAFLQQSGVEEDLRDASAKLIISTLRTNPPIIPGLEVVGNYYERVEIQTSDGAAATEIRAYSLAECPAGEYSQAKRDALKRLKNDPKIKQELDDLMAQQRDRANNDRTPSTFRVNTPTAADQPKSSPTETPAD